eukprot:CAMPEP_0178391254 /NCGR_PEP_ID=MMETSP0689_2-20121128/11071_1 /TAXON_ID=160604 /ORGANISM="Amphidinium massartii, Strain CS-259" /LENGTH=694 /DNA_ID=CAMNT_0020011797 /DNA_START=323 /DNA_END=2408 /DNA_ORIENTATION=+
MVFAVVFRTNLGWSRYWEAMTQQHFMYSKWSDALTQFCAFAHCTMERLEKEDDQSASGVAHMKRLNEKILSMKRNFSLLSAMAAHRLSHGDTQRMERRATSAKWADRVVFREELRTGQDLTGARVLPEFRSTRTGQTQSLKREWNSAFVVVDPPVDIEREVLDNSHDRVSVVMYWVLHDMASAARDLDIAPPIQSRMYQELSNGMLGFNNSLKIADVPFPFPYAQLLDMSLIAFTCFIPIYVSIFTQSLYAAPALAFVLFEGIWCFNEVAKELEQPYGSDANDMSLEDFHARFMSQLQELLPAQLCKKQYNDEFREELKPAARRSFRHVIKEKGQGMHANIIGTGFSPGWNPATLDGREESEAEAASAFVLPPQESLSASPPPPLVKQQPDVIQLSLPRRLSFDRASHSGNQTLHPCAVPPALLGERRTSKASEVSHASQDSRGSLRKSASDVRNDGSPTRLPSGAMLTNPNRQEGNGEFSPGSAEMMVASCTVEDNVVQSSTGTNGSLAKKGGSSRSPAAARDAHLANNNAAREASSPASAAASASGGGGGSASGNHSIMKSPGRGVAAPAATRSGNSTTAGSLLGGSLPERSAFIRQDSDHSAISLSGVRPQRLISESGTTSNSRPPDVQQVKSGVVTKTSPSTTPLPNSAPASLGPEQQQKQLGQGSGFTEAAGTPSAAAVAYLSDEYPIQ